MTIFDEIDKKYNKLKEKVKKDIEFDKKNLNLKIEMEQKFLKEYNEWKQEYEKRISLLAEKAENNPDAIYIRNFDKKNIKIQDIEECKIKGVKNRKGQVIENAKEFLESYSSLSFAKRKIKKLLEGEKPVFKYKNKTKFSYENPLKDFFKKGYIASHYKISFDYLHNLIVKDEKLESLNLRDICLDYKPIMKILGMALKKDGWKKYYSSGKAYSSSCYFEKDGETLRLSDHELPNTPERIYNTEQGLRSGWNYEFVLNDFDIIEFYCEKSLKNILTKFYEKINYEI